MTRAGRGTGEDAVEAAREEALRRLARRPLTAAELRRALERCGHAGPAIEAVLDGLRRTGLVDDRALALQYLLARAERLGHAPGRLVDELIARGVSAEDAAAARAAAASEHGLTAASLVAREVGRRLGAPGGATDAARARRVYNALLRAGFAEDDVRAALAAYLDGGDENEP